MSVKIYEMCHVRGGRGGGWVGYLGYFHLTLPRPLLPSLLVSLFSRKEGRCQSLSFSVQHAHAWRIWLCLLLNGWLLC